MKILLLGNGGRAHTMAWKIAQSEECSELYVAPGNAGTAEIGRNISVDPLDFEAVKKEIITRKIDFVIVGPEAPLVAGIVDFFRKDDQLKDIPILGPDAEAALLEGSKSYAKSFMLRHNIPTAGGLEVTAKNLDEGFAFLSSLRPPYVLKADGLAAGKGVLILDDLSLARRELEAMLQGKFGEASHKVVIEEFLDGTEFSVFALTDGKSYILLPEAKDYKRIGEGDTGLNTGGMGSVSPVPFFSGAFKESVIRTIVEPTIEGIAREGLDYTGFVFFGLIRVGDRPYVIEYNCRMGDPETQSVFPRIQDDVLPLLYQAAAKNLSPASLRISEQAACSIVAVSGGYPEAYEKGKKISGVTPSDTLIFHAGTTKDKAGDIFTNGGRVLAVTALDRDPVKACETALRAAERVRFEGIYFRKDIGRDILAKE